MDKKNSCLIYVFLILLLIFGNIGSCVNDYSANAIEENISWMGFEANAVRDKVINSIRNARKNIFISWYSFGDQQIAQALEEASFIVPISISTSLDNENASVWQALKHRPNVTFAAGNTNGLMHNKYLIVDEKQIITGSANFSKKFYEHSNVTLIINNKRLAQQYLIDFAIQWAGYYGSKKDQGFDLISRSENKSPFNFFAATEEILLQSVVAKAYFTPYRNVLYEYKNPKSLLFPYCEEECFQNISTNKHSACFNCNQQSCIAEQTGVYYRYRNFNKDGEYYCRRYDNAFNVLLPHIASAHKKILVLAFSLRDQLFVDRLLQAQARGVDVTILLDYSQYRSAYASFGNVYREMAKLGITLYIVRQKNNGLMHHKTIVIDDQVVVLGSLNFSQSAVNINDENFLILNNARHLAQKIKIATLQLYTHSVLLDELSP